MQADQTARKGFRSDSITVSMAEMAVYQSFEEANYQRAKNARGVSHFCVAQDCNILAGTIEKITNRLETIRKI